MLYLLIFFFKILENAISTLRVILVSNERKITGSILLFFISVIWIISSSFTIRYLNILAILAFAVGSLIGSYIGSLIEEKIAIGTNLIICISHKNIHNNLRKNGYIITLLKGKGMNDEKNVLMIAIERKKQNELINDIYELDNKAILVSEKINVV